jgi:large subunit ribosomal protein L24
VSVKMKIKKGDIVQMLSGKDRGKQGRVLEARPSENRVIVESLNMMKRHTKPRPISSPGRMGQSQLQPGGIIEKAAPVPVSKVMVVCPNCGRPTRVGVVVKEVKGARRGVRVCRRDDCRKEIDA